MKLKFESASELATLRAQLGLAEGASHEEIGTAVAARLYNDAAPEAPGPQASAGPTDYPQAWLSPSDLAPWPRPRPRVGPVERVTHGGD